MSKHTQSTLTRRLFVKGASACALAVGAPSLFAGSLGCRGRDPAEEASGLHGQVARKVTALSGVAGKTLTVLYPKGSLGNITPVVSAFRKLTRVNIELVEAELDTISAEVILANQVGGANTRFDVAIPATFGLPDLVEAGALEPLDALAARHEPPELMKRSIYTLGDRYKGKLYGYQADGDVYTMFYNRDWMTDPALKGRYEDTFGVSLGVARTWKELDRQMRFFHAPDQGRFGGSLFRNLNYVAWEFWARLHGNGLYPLSDAMEPRVATPQGQAALEALIATTRHLEPGAMTHGLFENFTSFADGTKFCNIGWGGTQKYLNGPDSKLRGRLAYGPVPGGEFGGQAVAMPYFNWGWNYVVSSLSAMKELAYLFVLFASTPHASTMSVREASGYFDPFRDEHYADPTIVKTYGEAFLKVHRESLSSCIPDLYLRGQGQYLAALKHAVWEACQGHISPQRALGQLAVKWNTITDTLGRAGQQEQWRFLKASYPKRLKALLT